VIFLFLVRGRRVDFGDVPTWLAVIAAVGAGWVALGAFRDQQKEFTRQVRQLERQQADAIDLTRWEDGSMFFVPDASMSMPRPQTVLAIENKSSRPIRDVRCRLWPEGDAHHVIVYATGPTCRIPNSSRPITEPTRETTVPLLRPGGWFAFLFAEQCKEDARYAVRFTDDAGLHWQIDRDLHLWPTSHPADW
jgi:hypothetical protein